MLRGTMYLGLIFMMIEGSSHTFASPSEIREGMCIVVNDEVEKKSIISSLIYQTQHKVLAYCILI